MSSIYKGVLTNNGKALIAQATTANRVGFSHIAIGDGNGSVPTPTDTRTALVRERHRLPLNSVEINPNNRNQIICEAIIPSNVGGWTIRELGLYAGSTMVVHSNYPATYKPTQTEGGARELVIRMVINVQSADVIALTLNDSLVYATREWVENNFVNHNEVINNLTSTEINKPLSANQGKLLEEKKLDKATIFTVEGNNKVYRYHDVAMFYKRMQIVTGVVAIKLPNYFTTMYTMLLQGFNYVANSSWSADISAYQYQESRVLTPSVNVHGNAPFGKVQFASKNGSHYILLGEITTAWNFPTIHIKEVLTHFFNQQHWATGYEFSVETDLSSFQILATPILYGTPRALSAEKLATPRQLLISGDATATANFDGTANANLALTLTNTGVTAGTYQSVTVDAKGRVSSGLAVVNGLVTATSATGTANQATSNDNTYLNLVTRTGTASHSAGSSTKITGHNGISVSSDTNGHLLISNDLVNHINNNDANKPASAWLTNYLQVNKLGKTENAVSASKLQTPSTINGVVFDGTQNITIADQTKVAKSGDTMTGSLNLSSDNTMVNVGNNNDFAVIKKAGLGGAIAFGENNRFRVYKSNNRQVNPSDTLTQVFEVDANGNVTATNFIGNLQGHANTSGMVRAIDNRYVRNSQIPVRSLSLYFMNKDGMRGLTGGNWGDFLVLNSYADASGGKTNALFFNKITQEIIHTQAPINSGSAWEIGRTLAYTDSNVASATKLQTPRTINGVSFDGTQDITIFDNTKVEKATKPANTDVRTLKQDGIYALGGGGTNLPSTSGAYKVLSLAGNNPALVHQLAIKAYSTEIWLTSQQSANSEEWLAWKRLDGADWADVRNKPTASLTQSGITQLNSSVNSDLETQSATPKAVKIVYDKANAIERDLSVFKNHTHTVSQITDFAQGVKSLIQRRDYTGTLTPSHNSFRTQTVQVTGSVEALPDGRIIQRFSFTCPVIYFHRYNLNAFYREKLSVSSFVADDSPLLEVPLWTAMPNKVQEARIHLSSNTAHYAFGEALEWNYDWDSIFNQHANIKDKAYFAFRRIAGSNNESVTFNIVVEGY